MTKKQKTSVAKKETVLVATLVPVALRNKVLRLFGKEHGVLSKVVRIGLELAVKEAVKK